MKTLMETVVGTMVAHHPTPIKHGRVKFVPGCSCGLEFGWHRNVSDLTNEHLATELHAALTAREDEIADGLRMAGAQLGAMPEFVAEVIAQLGLGTEPDAETRLHIHNQFHAGMARLQQMIEEHQRREDGN